MNNKVVSSIIAAAALSGVATAGEPVVQPVEAKAFSACDTLKSIGKVYKDKSNPFIQEVKVFGRAQWQYAYVDGENGAGVKDSEGSNEIRRLRAGAKVKAFNYFSLMGRANLEYGGADNHRLGFGGWDEAQLTFDAGKAFGITSFDKASITVGRDKVEIGEDVHTSSKKIKTVERTTLTGKIRPGNNTGVIVNLEKGDWKGAFGVYSAGAGNDRNFTEGFDNKGEFFYASSTFGLEGGELIFDFIKASGNDSEAAIGYDWASSVAYRTEVADWDLALNAVLGEDNGGDNFYGFVVQPSKFIIEDKLEAVGRYYFQGSDSDTGVRADKRYSRDILGNSGRGDAHHSLYGGLNYYLCGHNAKLMAGVEYETLDTTTGSADATTLWSAVRFYF